MSKLKRLLRSNLKLKHLQLLIALDDLRHVGKVAELMHLTQPGISKALAEMESLIGARLFERSSRSTDPTHQGRQLILFARETLCQLDRVATELEAIESGSMGTVHIGSMMTANALLLPRGISLLKQRSVNATVRVDDGLIENLVERLLLGQLDLLIGRLDAIKNPVGLEFEPLYLDAVVVVSGPSHPLAQRQNLSWRDFDGEAWVLPPPDSAARSRFDQQLTMSGLSPLRDLVETGSFLSLVTLLRERRALAILSESLARYFQQLGVLLILDAPQVHAGTSIGFARVAGRRDSPPTELLCDCIRQAAREMSEHRAKKVMSP